MRAAVYHGVDGLLSIDELPVPQPKAGEVLIKTAACGVCQSDLHVLRGNTPFPVPSIVGHEVSGVVAATGPGVTTVAVGDRVAASFIMPCSNCRFCLRGDTDLCSNFLAMNRAKGTLYDGESRYRTASGEQIAMYSMGAMSEYCVIPANDVFIVPDEVDLVEAAVLGCSVFTAYGAVHNIAKVGLGQTVGIVGVGGVGAAAVSMAKIAGATTIVAIDLEQEKLDAAVRHGATHAINANKDVDAQVREITGGAGLDVVIEAIGTPETVRTALDIVDDGGHVVVVGLARAGTDVGVDLSRLVRRRVTLSGSYGARPQTDMPAVLRLVEAGLYRPSEHISDRFKLDEVNEAYARLLGRQITGRAVVVMDH